jgi:hypothetical protein
LGSSFNLRTSGEVRVEENRYSWSTVARQLDTYVAWKLDSKTQLRFSAWNLLKQDYRSKNIYIRDNGSLSSEQTSFGVRNIRLQLETRF